MGAGSPYIYKVKMGFYYIYKLISRQINRMLREHLLMRALILSGEEEKTKKGETKKYIHPLIQAQTHAHTHASTHACTHTRMQTHENKIK